MVESRIARRYLWAARKQLHTIVLSLISILGLAIGVAALLISIALLTGLQGQIKQRLISSSPQILVEPARANTIDDAGAIVATAKKLGMTRVEPLVTGLAWGANEEQRRGRPMRVTSSPRDELRGDEPAIVTTRDFAAGLGLDAGDSITVIAPRSRLTPFGPVPVWRRYRIARLVPADEHTDAWFGEREAADFFATGGKPTRIEMFGGAEFAEAIQPELARRFPAVLVKTWKEINRPLFLALRLEKIVMFATISMIIFVAALNLISSLSMLISEKRPQVGVLRTLGATEKNILSIFLQVGLFIGLAGTLLGNLFGIGFAWAADHYHLVPLPRDIYFVSYLPFKLDLGDVAGVNAVAILLSVLATWYPARVASRLDPINAIREE